MLRALVLMTAVYGVCACTQPANENGPDDARVVYDQTTGRLTRVAGDLNGNGRVDSWTYMDGSTPLRTESDLDEDGKIDRWEYNGPKGELLRVERSRQGTGKPDTWEFYDADVLTRTEEDTNQDGKPDKWDDYAGGVLRSSEFDEDYDSVRDRRLTYGAKGALTVIETDADGRGGYRQRLLMAQ